MTKTKVLICPYCGETQTCAERCRGCGGLFEPLSRQATHNAMGPWFVRDPGKPFHPGCNYETLVRMIDRGQVTKYSIVRGPTTKQFWTVAKHVPGVSHLLGYCHNCDASVDAGDHGCHVCGVPFGAYLDHNHLGLPAPHPLPWEAELDGADGGPDGANLGLGRPSRPVGISGFATDDELFDSAQGQPWTQLRSPETELDDATPASVFDDHVSPVTTALRRKLEGQHRTIRTLVILLVAVIVISVIAALTLLPREPAGVAPAPGSPTVAAPAPDTQAPPSMESQPPVASDPQPVQRPETEPVEQEAAPVVDPVVAAYTRARQLIASAGREDRTAEERMAFLVQALKELTTIAETASEANRPGDLDETTEQVRQELERLDLVGFFGDKPPRD